MPKKTKKVKLSAFTLIELLLVTAIIGTLAAIVVVSLAGNRDKAKAAETRAEIRQYMTAVKVFYDDKGYYPNDIPYYPVALSGSYVGKDVTAATFVDGWGSTMDWDNWCDTSGARGRDGTACALNSDVPAGPIGFHSPGPDKTWSTGDDIRYGSRGYPNQNY